MTSFALRSSDNALVWVKDAPEKPKDCEGDKYPAWQCFTSSGLCKCRPYKSALKQAIETGIVVADDEKMEIKMMLSRAYADKYGFRDSNFFYDNFKPDTLYHLDVEMEERQTECDPKYPVCEDGCWGAGCRYRKIIAFMVEPKEVAPDDKMRDFKPTILRQILLNVFHHQEGLYVEDAAKEIERLFAPVSKEEPKQESQSMDEAIMWEEVYFETPGSAKDFWKFFNAVTANFTITRK
ncbi:MAG TPA: hypothetical protein PK059_02150 [Cyclobacteriaceae bacterium]|nr:hypothetical protein [Cyclobacteriaceae bacterium]